MLFRQVNRVKGAAIRTGIEHATGDVIIFNDADLEYGPSEFSSYLNPLILFVKG